MIFKGVDGQTVEFKIINYQFPEIKTPDDWDSNWLLVYLKVNSKLGNWETTDPSLATGELKELASWFKDLSESKEVKYKELGFTEPNLEFSFIETNNDLNKIRIIFDYESKPISAKNTEKEYFVDCLFTNNELSEIALELEKELAKYPPR